MKLCQAISIFLILLEGGRNNNVASAKTTTWYRLDRDTSSDCADRIETCRSSDTTYRECPNTCAASLGEGIVMEKGWTARDNEEFYQLEATCTSGKHIEFDRLERYVTIIAALPLLPGMAQYYYDLTEHFAQEHPYAVSTVILPFSTSVAEEEAMRDKLDFLQDDKETTTNKSRRRRHSLVLKTHVAESLNTHPVVKYIESTAHRHGKPNPLFSDRATIFLISHDGHTFEKQVCPTMKQMRKLLETYLGRLEHDQEL